MSVSSSDTIDSKENNLAKYELFSKNTIDLDELHSCTQTVYDSGSGAFITVSMFGSSPEQACENARMYARLIIAAN